MHYCFHLKVIHVFFNIEIKIILQRDENQVKMSFLQKTSSGILSSHTENKEINGKNHSKPLNVKVKMSLVNPSRFLHPDIDFLKVKNIDIMKEKFSAECNRDLDCIING